MIGTIYPFSIYLSHRDADHYANCVELVKKYDIEKIYMPHWGESGGNLCDEAKTKWREIRTNIQNAASEAGKQVTIQYLKAGDTFEIGRFKARVLYGPTGLKDSNGDDINSPNNESLVTMIESPQGVRYLTAGDIESETEDILIELSNQGKINLSADIFKANHHGRYSNGNPSNQAAFVNLIKPSYYYYNYIFNHDLDGDGTKEYCYRDIRFGQQCEDRTSGTVSNSENKTKEIVETLSKISNGYSTAYNGQVIFEIYNTTEIVPRPERNYYQKVEGQDGYKFTYGGREVCYRLCNLETSPSWITNKYILTNRMKQAIAKKVIN